jgi:hypothetical protein
MKINIILITILFPLYFSFGQNEIDKNIHTNNTQQNKIVNFETTSDSSIKPLKIEITNLPQKTFWEIISPFLMVLLGVLIGWFPTYLSQKKNIKYQDTLQKKKDWVEKFRTVIAELSTIMLFTGDMFRNSESSKGLRHMRAGNQNPNAQTIGNKGTGEFNSKEILLNQSYNLNIKSEKKQVLEKISICFNMLGYLLDQNKSMHKELSSLLTDTYTCLFNNVSENIDEKIMDNIGKIIKLAHKIVEEEAKKI